MHGGKSNYDDGDDIILIIKKLIMMVVMIREHLLKKGMFSFGHCPNYLSPLPLFRATCTSFSAVKAIYIYCIF